MTDLKDIRYRLERLKGTKDSIENSLHIAVEELQEHKRSLRRHEQAREIMKEVALKTQQTLQVRISGITTLALEAVFPDPYELLVEFVQRRNKTECDLLFLREGNTMDPLEASGGGAVDIAAFALRIASYTMQRPKSRPVIILDEPMRFLSEDYQEQASQMIKELSDKLGIQFIIITHEETLAKFADKIFMVTKVKGKSKISKYI
jgi:ABC-type glutathione transport system ATPase component